MNRRGFLKGFGILVASMSIPKIMIGDKTPNNTEKPVKKQRIWSSGREQSVLWYEFDRSTHEFDRSIVAGRTTWTMSDGKWNCK